MASPLPRLHDPTLLKREHLRFHQRDCHYNEVLNDVSELRRRIRLDSPSTWSMPKTESVDAGIIGTLPFEGIVNVLRHTTISDLFKLRATNSRIRYIIEQWEPFKLINTHGGDAVRALLATGAGLLWTAGQLINVLFTTKCELCGQHGDILHLLKLKRCCFRCLSQERELLAVTIEYAQQFLRLSDEELEKLPKLRTILQKDFWGFPSLRGIIVDYQTALKVSGDRALNYPGKYPTPALYSYKVKRTRVRLESNHRSIQPRPRTRLHERRGHTAAMKLPSPIFAAPETDYRQHACAVRQPAMTRKRARVTDGTFKDNVTVVNGVRCEGCAYYWNYHSPLPYHFHKMYTHEQTGGPTEFTKHLQHCIYAQAHWARINNPRRPVPLQKQIEVLDGWRNSFWPRHPAPTLEQSTPWFELIPQRLENELIDHETNFRTFEQPYEWPALPLERPETDDEALMRWRIEYQGHKAAEDHRVVDDFDLYWDMLISQEAVSQSNWACGTLCNGSFALFRGPYTLLESKRARHDRKF
ncbi:uncharacterized protein A1O9_07358 [Exophiala aquamarina CBS 119918]|uniref:F-box domain-containing protein n=1 Tax=Exophiala aquamarina CBS 119918 TaxID=1182545 RepID=A0A072PD05_9EURO|nr:uncharacterized protein A1O9_07358 [Exophiala aquamarina CBS 119918]KEF57168.1 hypothetical protein A1O9_07358 [Exophiala aquamarina CBS 119918]